MKTPGQAAYEKWRELVPTTIYLPVWDELSGRAKGGWEEIAEAAYNQIQQQTVASRMRLVQGERPE